MVAQPYGSKKLLNSVKTFKPPRPAQPSPPAKPSPALPSPAQPSQPSQPSPAPSARFKIGFQGKLPKTFGQNVSVNTFGPVYWQMLANVDPTQPGQPTEPGPVQPTHHQPELNGPPSPQPSPAYPAQPSPAQLIFIGWDTTVPCSNESVAELFGRDLKTRTRSGALYEAGRNGLVPLRSKNGTTSARADARERQRSRRSDMRRACRLNNHGSI